jgi:hypothetical protein
VDGSVSAVVTNLLSRIIAAVEALEAGDVDLAAAILSDLLVEMAA